MYYYTWTLFNDYVGDGVRTNSEFEKKE